MRDQRIRDPIHNLIKFSSEDDEVLWSLIQTPPFQRLRRIKQLGFSDFVYPGAVHTRFSHSIGAMQMARRMLAVLARNQMIKEADQKEWQRATLCAVLLHDLGHGPFSHVFEGISESQDIKKSHEDYTVEIIEAPDIRDILEKNESGLSQKIVNLLRQEPGQNIYSQIVSGQLDADRLDFLSRDRYFTGIRVAEIDLEWLFDSLTVDEVPADGNAEVLEIGFVFSSKGRAVIEEYLFSYAHMYTNVYFHKTTRGVETLVKEIFRNILIDPEAKKTLVGQDPLLGYLWDPEQRTLKQYLTLDDVVFLSTLKKIASGKYGEASDLAARFFARELLKCYEPAQTNLVAAFKNALKAVSIRYCDDKTPPKGYKQFEIFSEGYLQNIMIQNEGNKKPEAVVLGSPVVTHMAGKTRFRFYFFTEHDRDEAKRIWKNLL